MTDGPAAHGNQERSAAQADAHPSPSPTSEHPAGPSTRERVPRHLCHLIVEQAYEAYNAVDQAVWRFVLTQIFDTLRHSAHPAYEKGLAEAGISTERIPRIEEMDRCLARFGWGAVCVDGFIPPRAFVELQALGILPIAADMRTARHLVYTPAPDIIHEAAGHAPILPDAAYAEFLRRIGSAGAAAFSSKEDENLYRAIYDLSETKERPDASNADIARAERAFEEAAGSVTRVTEATRMSRLYWWTAEYGLVGTPKDYRLFGAGLLSSLGESYSCHDRSVKKVPLDAACTEVAYDVTRAQPQLFVARDFDHLQEVLSDVLSTLSVSRGGAEGLREAVLSEELATVRVGEDRAGPLVDLIGVVESFETREPGGPCRVRLRGPWGVAVSGTLVADALPSQLPEHAELFVGAAPAAFEGDTCRIDREVSLDVAGAPLRGRISHIVRNVATSHDALLIGLMNAHWADTALPGLTLVARGHVCSVRAGAVDPAFHASSSPSARRVPGARNFSAEDQRLIHLYEEVLALWRSDWGTNAARAVTRLIETLDRSYPDEWLLRYHLLELLLRAGERSVSPDLRSTLERLEVRFSHREPIALGLRRLARLAS